MEVKGTKMSRVKVSLRLRGEFDNNMDLLTAFRGMPIKLRRRGEKLGNRVQPMDVLLLDLAAWDNASAVDQEVATTAQLLPAAAALQRLAPILAQRDRSRCDAELYISTVRKEDQGGFELPMELVSAAANGKVSIGVSILVMLDDYDPDENTASK